MKKLTMIFALVALVGLAGWAQGFKAIKGDLLRSDWESVQRDRSTRTSLDNVCTAQYYGFVWGVVGIGVEMNLFSIPSDATYEQIYAVVGKYLENHPEEWNISAAVMVREALAAVWPAKK